MTSDSRTDWSKFASLKSVIVFASIIILMFVVIFVVGLYSNKNIEFFGLKIRNVDTIYISNSGIATGKTVRYDRLLTESELKNIIRQIRHCQVRDTADSCIHIFLAPGASSKMVSQLTDYLNDKGFDATAGGIGNLKDTVEGAVVLSHMMINNCMTLYLGVYR
jgi:hypothetical protein